MTISPPYFQTHIEDSKKDNAFRTLQGAMAWMEKHPDVTGTIYYLPPLGDLAYIVMEYTDGDIEEKGKE
jgi:hypothetical protein